MAQQIAEDTVDHVVDVVLARAQVGVFHLLEHRDQRVALQLDRPFGVDEVVADDTRRLVVEGRVIKHQHVGVDEGHDLGRCAARDMGADLAQVMLGQAHRCVQPRDLTLDLAQLEVIFGDVELITLNDVHAANGDTARYRDPMQ